MGKKTKRDDWTVEQTERNGIVIETTYDGEGNVVAVKKWVKPEKRPKREKGPVRNVEQWPE